jgi:hypothetical protein
MANEAQAGHWNSAEASHWVTHQLRYDTMLGPFGDRLLAAALEADRRPRVCSMCAIDPLGIPAPCLGTDAVIPSPGPLTDAPVTVTFSGARIS